MLTLASPTTLAALPTLAQGSTIATGALPLALVVALAAGFVSFASPCVLPLVPGFLGYVTGLSDVALERRRRSRLVLGALLFVLGFAAVFIVLTALFASAVSLTLRSHLDVLTRVGGVVVIVMAVAFLGFGARAGLQRSAAPRWRAPAGLVGAPLLGVIFALTWAPCSGPTLAAILALTGPLSGDGGGVGRGILLAVAYSLGLGVPFLLIAAGYSKAGTTSAWLRRHQRPIHLFGGGLLLVLGVLMATGAWNAWIVPVQTHLVGTFTTVL